MSKELSPEHRLFINALMENGGDVQGAAEMAGFTPQHGYYLVRQLRKEIIEAAEHIMALYAPRAAHTIVTGLTDVTVTNTKIECAKQLLDRVGIVKKEKIEVTGELPPIFVLPAKNEKET